ncbi:MAG: DUF2752 domain-containing protein [Lachnospiraceae bacterium]|nr:DUF2752 domain-containing protein [Lachnospiraceae bacterium]
MEDNLFYLGCVFLGVSPVAGVLFYYVLLPYLSLPPCVLYQHFGLYCPGCGGTRAFVSLLQGHFLRSLWYHPLVPYAALLFGAFMLSQAAARLTHFHYFHGLRFHSWYLYGALGVLGGNWIIKNLLLLCLGIRL